MAEKGAKYRLSPQAQRMYADGSSLSDISTALDVSVTSLARWKADTKRPSADMDEWDRARNQKRGNIQRLRDLFEEQLSFFEELRPDERTSAMMDTLSKMGALLERWDKMEKAQKVAEEVVAEVKKAGVTAETEERIRQRILGIGA